MPQNCPQIRSVPYRLLTSCIKLGLCWGWNSSVSAASLVSGDTLSKRLHCCAMGLIQVCNLKGMEIDLDESTRHRLVQTGLATRTADRAAWVEIAEEAQEAALCGSSQWLQECEEWKAWTSLTGLKH